MKPYYDKDGITIYHGDCREVLLELKPAALVLTDPPYGIDLNTDYLTGRNQLIRRSSPKVWERIKGDAQGIDFSFVFKLPGVKVVFGANNFPQQLPFNALADGWIVWDKRTNENADKILGSPFEMAVVIGRRTYKIIRMQHCGVKNIDGDNAGRFHPTQKPIKLMMRLLQMFDYPTALDPFMGSGSMLLAAKILGRRAVGIEIEEKYCQVTVERLEFSRQMRKHAKRFEPLFKF